MRINSKFTHKEKNPIFLRNTIHENAIFFKVTSELVFNKTIITLVLCKIYKKVLEKIYLLNYNFNILLRTNIIRVFF